MRVEKPRFDDAAGGLRCEDCPLADEAGIMVRGTVGDICMEFGPDCPTAETYESACRLAEQAEKGEAVASAKTDRVQWGKEPCN